ncbi:MAG: 1,4-dihydroxy-2-naphthoate octaprenyltransferase [Verrucomicrobiaceae bacterium]|nr:1,4-dihydroxy-2-naphthoate octaprenyltransferase [Verrucomicrobiaceae bacterium]
MTSLAHWIHAARPKTLGAAVAPVAVGTVIGWKADGVFHGGLALATLGSCVALQVATNWFNDALDFVKGADTAARVGPRRITASGVVTVRAVLTAALLMLAVATALSIPLCLARGWPILAIGIPSLYFCYGYTGGPMPLAYRGLGELFVILFFGLVAVTGSAFVQSGRWLADALVGGLQVGCLSTVLIAVNNLRDMHEDRLTGKRTLAVRLGAKFARIEIYTLLVLPHLLGIWWLMQDRKPAFAWPLPCLGIAFGLIQWIGKTEPGPLYNRFLALAGIQLLAFALLLCFGLAHA